MPKAKTPSFILELGLETDAHDEAELNKRFSAARQLYNACLDEAKRRLELLRQSKEFQQARKMPKTVNGKQNKERTEAFKRLNTKFGFSEYDLHIYATTIRNSWIGNHIDSTTTQKIATRAFKVSCCFDNHSESSVETTKKAVQRIAFGQAKRIRFKGKNQLKSVEGKTNKTGIRYNVLSVLQPIPKVLQNGQKDENTGHIEWNGLKLKCIIDVCRRRRRSDASHPDEVVVHGLSCPVKYCRIVKRIFNVLFF